MSFNGDYLCSWWRITAFVFAFAFIRLVRCSALNSDGGLLLSLKYSILSDPLSVLDNWNYNDLTPCSWTGVTCTEIGAPGTPDMFRVTGLVLSNCQLLGSIPEDLCTIEHLQRLDLSSNFFNGSLPTSLFEASELRVLSLANNVISGELPEFIGGMKSLQLLNLSDNALAGTVSENLTALENLTVVSLRSNYFSGTVPGGFKLVQVLDLSSNLFNGSLPIDFGGESLSYLNLSYNKVSGTIPSQFAEKIPGNATIDLSSNDLTGQVPETAALIYQKPASFAGNLDLCGKPLKKLCTVPSTQATPPNVTTTTSPPAIAAIPRTTDSSPVTSSPQTQQESGMNPGTVAGIAVGDLAGIAILAMIFIYVYQLKKRKKLNDNEKTDSLNKPNPEKKETTQAWSCLTKPKNGEEEETETETETGSEDHRDDGNKKEMMKNGEGSVVTLDGETQLELETLLKASAYILGATGPTIVYKAVLEDGTALAVRRIGESRVEKFKDFENQVRLIAKLRHPNLVRVRGFYWGSDEKLIIYEYVSNGSLASTGHRKMGSSPTHMPLELRFRIAKGVARGLAYIHEKKHVHGNLKPSNILLTPEMEPIIADFGLDRFLSGDYTHKDDASGRHFSGKRSTTFHDLPQDYPTAGTSAGILSPYHPPEWLRTLKPNPKWDVYSFGIVLLELLTGRVFLDGDLGQLKPGGSGMEERDRVLRMADVGIRGDVEGREDATLACFKLGFNCASSVPQKRPTMKEALQILEKISPTSP
ncbi:hypothetical protein PVL29_003263 [Vitis rotundifolia]|uniref:Protein kinase domain-containing protein n=1 Tax=Vitis rotundifolia TaxID=103349 RepID=A0AA39E3D1_VITRO|nr:hypothetical protein PVL29_003263 [Vitis rotundifolia]